MRKARAFNLYGFLGCLGCVAVDVHGTLYELSTSSPGDQGKPHELYTASLPHLGTIAKAVRMATVMAQKIRHHESHCTG